MTTADADQHAVIPFYRDERKLAILAQIIFVVVVVGFISWLITNMFIELDNQDIRIGFGFLDESARFPIAVAGDMIEYTANDSYSQAFLTGLFNTIIASVVGIFFATILGIITGIARLSGNWLINQIAAVYISIIRNTPLVVQLVFWYTALILKIPAIEDSVNVFGLALISNRGTAVLKLTSQQGSGVFWGSVLVAIVAAYFVNRQRNQHFEETGEPPNNLLWAGGTFALIAAIGYGIGYAIGGGALPVMLEFPSISENGRTYATGFRVSPEYTALVLGLTVSTASYIAEIVRAGIQSVSKGQVEASRALGLTGAQSMRLVIFPQALRVIIPPLTSQYLNLTKNSSLASIIGYQDLYLVVQTIFNQNGRAVESIGMMMGTYLTLSLLTSLLLNWYNKRIQLVER